jgi:hypothetical protein
MIEAIGCRMLVSDYQLVHFVVYISYHVPDFILFLFYVCIVSYVTLFAQPLLCI